MTLEEQDQLDIIKEIHKVHTGTSMSMDHQWHDIEFLLKLLDNALAEEAEDSNGGQPAQTKEK